MSDKEQRDNVIHVNFGASSSSPVDVASMPTPMTPYDPALLPDDELAPKKFEIFGKFIENGMVSVTFDTRVPGVEIPPLFRDRPRLVLNFSHKFFIDDFSFDPMAVCASLSFGGQPYFCVVPWASVKMFLSHYDNAVAVFEDV